NQLFNESIALEDSLLKHINENITLIQDLIEQIETALNLKFPYYTLEGPDNGLVKNAIAFSYKFSKGVTAQSTGGVLYNDEDENINSENFSVTPTEPGYWLFNRSSKNGNFTFVKYHLMNIKPSNQAPVITDHFPKSREININSSDDLLKFRVSATDPEGDPLKYEWFINGNPAGNTDSLSLALLTCSNAYYKILVRVTDTETGNYHGFQEWDVSITGDNALCNNAPSAKNATYWYFGYNSGLRFGGSRPVPLTDGILSNFEGASSMSDTAGNFLFSSDGMKVWNRLHKQMPNGNNLISHPSATQGPITVPYPGQPDKYILFTVGVAWGGPTDIAYNVINMKLDNGLGDLESKNVKISITSSEKLAAVYHHNRRHIWVLTHDPLKKRMLAFLVTENGVSHVPVISEFPVPVSNDKGPGYMRFSPDGRTIATANFQSNVDLYDFDNKTGVVSNLRTIQLQNILKGYGSYGIEFSPNNKLLYVADHRGENRIYQLGLSYPTPQEIANNRFVLEASPAALGALQLGPDGRIYVARENMQWLGVINNPNEKGSNSNYVLNGQSLAGKKSSLGLPGFISSVFIRNQIAYSGNCAGMSASFS
ncbi:MAG: hypothetical protein H3C48_19375, partial [Chitinophagaceae bacterium]|nr:hypothetical protein [Chitinophagaceae bacterium]